MATGTNSSWIVSELEDSSNVLEVDDDGGIIEILSAGKAQEVQPMSKSRRRKKRGKNRNNFENGVEAEKPVTITNTSKGLQDVDADLEPDEIMEVSHPNKKTKSKSKSKRRNKQIDEATKALTNSLERDCSVSSGEEEDELEDANAKELVDKLGYTYFTHGVFYRRHDHNSILLLVEKEARVYFSGRVELQVLHGRVEVYGYTLSRQGTSSFQVFSPKGHSSLLYIQGMGATEENEEVIEDFPAGFQFSGVILRSFENNWTLGLRQTAVNGEELVGPQISTKIHLRLAQEPENDSEIEEKRKKLPSMKHFLDKFGFQFIPERLLQKNRLFLTNLLWEQTLDELKLNDNDYDPKKITVFGGKGVGKSTFCRWLTNKCLSSLSTAAGTPKILYVDLDPGQTEFTPPGLVSIHVVTEPLLGPNFTHLRQPEMSIFLGGVNVADFPVSYVGAMMKLFDFASQNYPDIPWIINTMGFCSGLGIPLNVSVIKIFRPTVLVQLSVPNKDPKRSFPFDLTPENVAAMKATHFLLTMRNYFSNFDEIWATNVDYRYGNFVSVCGREEEGSSAKTNPWGSNPKSLRESMTISYFAEMIGSSPDRSLLPLEPFRFSLDSGTIGTMYTNSLNWDGVIRTLLGNLVALCKLSDEVLQSQAKCRQEGNPPQNRTQTLPSSTFKFISTCAPIDNECLGYGICRAYDKSDNFLYFLTPIPAEKVKQVNAIICAGGVGMPVPLLAGGKNNGKVGPYLSTSGGSGSSMLDAPSQRKYVPGKKVTHSVLKDCFL